MSTTLPVYCRINEEGVVEYFRPTDLYMPDGITDEVLEVYTRKAEEAGYKPLHTETRPHFLCDPEFHDSEGVVICRWVDLPLETAKTVQRTSVKYECNAARVAAFSIYTDAEQIAAQDNSDITVQTMAAVRNVTVEQQQADIDQALQMGKVINGALAGYYLRLEDDIKAATSVSEVASHSWDAEEFNRIVSGLLS